VELSQFFETTGRNSHRGIAKLSQAIEVNRPYDIAGGGSSGNALPGKGKHRWSEGGSRSWSARSIDKPWRSIFEELLAAHRGAADAAGTDWKSAICGKIAEEIQAQRSWR
jgi:hypothetical protein